MIKFKFYNNMSARTAIKLFTGRYSDMYLSIVMLLEDILASTPYVDTTNENDVCISIIDKTKESDGFSLTAMLLNGEVSLIVQTDQCKGTTAEDTDTCWYVESAKYGVDVRACNHLDAIATLRSITDKVCTVA